ncbi:hypothetical protein HDU93_003179, partial [Gonapodya sp. JEL0774]
MLGTVMIPVAGFLQCALGAIAWGGLCGPEELYQCLAHHIMGSAFVIYGFVLLSMAKLGGVSWLARKGWSPELIDGSVIFIWGVINTFALHRGGPWTHKDLQHVSLGLLWVFGGSLAVFLAWPVAGSPPRRNVLPALVIAITGWGMGEHGQAN